MNKAILIGNVGKEPEVRTTESGTSVANFSVATNESYKDANGNKVDKTEWHNVVIWGNRTKVCDFISKGSKVAIEGKIQTRKWQDKDGNDRYTTEILAHNIELLDSKKDGSQSQSQSTDIEFKDNDTGLPF